MKILQVIAIAGVMGSPALAFAEEALAPLAQEQAVIAVEEVGASLTPAEKHQQRLEKERMKEGNEMTPKMKASQNSMKFPTEHHKNAYHSLSKKNQKAYDALEDHEQDRVAETYKNGGNHQKTVTRMLKKDQKMHERSTRHTDMDHKEGMHEYKHDEGMEDSPASRAMKKQSMKSSKKKNDIFG